MVSSIASLGLALSCAHALSAGVTLELQGQEYLNLNTLPLDFGSALTPANIKSGGQEASSQMEAWTTDPDTNGLVIDVSSTYDLSTTVGSTTYNIPFHLVANACGSGAGATAQTLTSTDAPQEFTIDKDNAMNSDCDEAGTGTLGNFKVVLDPYNDATNPDPGMGTYTGSIDLTLRQA